MHPIHRATRPDGEQTLTVFLPSGPLQVNGDHPQYQDILSGAKGGADPEDLLNLADLSKVVAERFDALSERVKVAGGTVYFDGDPINTVLTKHIVRALDEEADFRPLVNFFEKVASNPNSHSREQLYEWLDKRDFAIAPDGDFYAYKGCGLDQDGVAISLHSGKAVVNGVAVNGQVPNPIGGVVEFPRSEVDWDPARGCARGLHVGSRDYAESYARSGVLLLVKVNPRDVVSVPTDSNWAKVRVSRYEVLNRWDNEASIAQAVYDWEDPDDYVEVCEDCDQDLPDNGLCLC